MNPFKRALIGFLSLWLFLLSGVAMAEQGLLWHISGKGGNGYLFGTMHSEDPRVTHLPPEVERQFAAASTLVLEVPLDERSEMAAAVQMMLPQGSSLSAVVGEELAAQAKQLMLAHGVPQEATEQLQPWAIALTLSMPQSQTGLFLDKLLYLKADENDKSFEPLESINEQIAVFSGLTASEKKELLRSTVEEYPTYPQLFEQMTDAYLARDLGLLMQISEENSLVGDVALKKKMMSRLLDDRNQRMVRRIQWILKRDGAFIAVGALHLPGDNGLLNLLRQKGYLVEAVY